MPELDHSPRSAAPICAQRTFLAVLVTSLCLVTMAPAAAWADEEKPEVETKFDVMHGLVGAELFGAKATCLHLSGRAKYKMKNGRIKSKVKSIENDCTNRSGSLKVSIWATPYSYSGGTIRGYVLDDARLDPLKAGWHYRKVKMKDRLRFPPRGTYSIVMTLSEWNGDWYVIDHINFNNTVRFY